MPSENEKVYGMLIQINNNLIQVYRLLQKITQDGVNVRTQESHSP